MRQRFKGKIHQLSYIARSYLQKERRPMISSSIYHCNHLLRCAYDKDFIFIHINKTAGSSISSLLGTERVHLTACTIRSLMREEVWASKFKFSIVRNPWDRVVSQYHHRLGVNQQKMKESGISFSDWVEEVYVEKNIEFINFHSMFMPQLNWVSDMDGNVIVDFIGRFENLEEDIAYIKNRLKITEPLPHLRSSNRNHYNTYYDSRTKNIIGDYFEKDIAHFNYEF